MNKVACFLALAFLSVLNAHADQLGVPFLPEQDIRFDILENAASSQVIGTMKGEKGHTASELVSHHAKAIVTLSASGSAVSTGIVLPKNSIIQQAYWYMSASGTPAAGTTLAFQCVAANDIYTATDYSAVQNNAITAGVETGTAATMLYAANGCTVKYVIGVHTPVNSVVDLFLDYVVAK